MSVDAAEVVVQAPRVGAAAMLRWAPTTGRARLNTGGEGGLFKLY